MKQKMLEATRKELKMNPSHFEHLPPFIKREIEKISEKIQPLLKKNSTYFLFGFPLMLVGILNIMMYFTQGNINMDSALIPGLYAIMAAVGLALFQESKSLRKQINIIGKEHMVERIKQSEVMEEAKKKKYILTVEKQTKMDLQPFFNFLTEEDKEQKNSYF
jgi:hypothetical protein